MVMNIYRNYVVTQICLGNYTLVNRIYDNTVIKYNINYFNINVFSILQGIKILRNKLYLANSKTSNFIL